MTAHEPEAYKNSSCGLKMFLAVCLVTQQRLGKKIAGIGSKGLSILAV
jgi:hypothetical protein